MGDDPSIKHGDRHASSPPRIVTSDPQPRQQTFAEFNKTRLITRACRTRNRKSRQRIVGGDVFPIQQVREVRPIIIADADGTEPINLVDEVNFTPNQREQEGRIGFRRRETQDYLILINAAEDLHRRTVPILIIHNSSNVTERRLGYDSFLNFWRTRPFGDHFLEVTRSPPPEDAAASNDRRCQQMTVNFFHGHVPVRLGCETSSQEVAKTIRNSRKFQ